MSVATEATEEMLIAYHELNGNVEELDEEPSALDFMRFVAKNRPFVVRRGCLIWPAVRKWNAAYLRKIMGNFPVTVAVTPSGNADSVVKKTGNSSMYWAQPLELDEPFSLFLNYLQDPHPPKASRLIKYSQAQNDNLRGEYLLLYKDVETDIRWATMALRREPDAINLWIGCKDSTTALHRDNYENIYCQITGSKHFVLLPPIETPCINEQFLPSAAYDANMHLIPDDPPNHVPCAIWDPDEPNVDTTRFSHLSKPARVRLDPGDMLYLPACWYHKVSQENSTEGISVSVNYWYDMDFDGIFHASNSFMRKMAWAVSGRNEHHRAS